MEQEDAIGKTQWQWTTHSRTHSHSYSWLRLLLFHEIVMYASTWGNSRQVNDIELWNGEYAFCCAPINNDSLTRKLYSTRPIYSIDRESEEFCGWCVLNDELSNCEKDRVLSRKVFVYFHHSSEIYFCHSSGHNCLCYGPIEVSPYPMTTGGTRRCSPINTWKFWVTFIALFDRYWCNVIVKWCFGIFGSWKKPRRPRGYRDPWFLSAKP